MNRSYKTEELILRSVPTLEADRLITVLSPSMGKFRATVKGARRIKSRLGGHLDVLNRVTLNLVTGRNFEVVTGVEAIETFGALKGSLERLAQALYLAELVERMTPERDSQVDNFAILLNGLRYINTKGINPAVVRYLELQLLSDSGYMPELNVCARCNQPVGEEPLSFAPDQGGILCKDCANSTVMAMPFILPRMSENHSRMNLTSSSLAVCRTYSMAALSCSVVIVTTPYPVMHKGRFHDWRRPCCDHWLAYASRYRAYS